MECSLKQKGLAEGQMRQWSAQPCGVHVRNAGDSRGLGENPPAVGVSTWRSGVRQEETSKMLCCNPFLWFTYAIQSFPSSADTLEVSEVGYGRDPSGSSAFLESRDL